MLFSFSVVTTLRYIVALVPFKLSGPWLYSHLPTLPFLHPEALCPCAAAPHLPSPALAAGVLLLWA